MITQSTPKLCTLSSDLFIKESQFCQLLLMASPQDVWPGDQASHLAPCLRFSLLSHLVRIPSQTLRYLLYTSPLNLQLLKTVLCFPWEPGLLPPCSFFWSPDGYDTLPLLHFPVAVYWVEPGYRVGEREPDSVTNSRDQLCWFYQLLSQQHITSPERSHLTLVTPPCCMM